eukprot:2534104-Amphidinium_carterae.1
MAAVQNPVDRLPDGCLCGEQESEAQCCVGSDGRYGGGRATARSLETMVAEWRESQNDGEEPPSDVEASGEQLSGLQRRLELKMTPCMDFAVFRPFSPKIMRKLKFTTYHVGEKHWGIVAEADMKMKAEEMERIRRQCAKTHQERASHGLGSDYDPN